MDASKQRALEVSGYRLEDYREFLGLSDAERRLIELMANKMTFWEWLVSLFRRKPAPPPAPPEPDGMPAIGDVVGALNVARSMHGLSFLTETPQLDACAQVWATECHSSGIVIHSPTWNKRIGYYLGVTPQSEGECIATGQTTASDCVTAWMNDPPHRAIVLGESYNLVGIGISVATKPYQGFTFVADFARV